MGWRYVVVKYGYCGLTRAGLIGGLLATVFVFFTVIRFYSFLVMRFEGIAKEPSWKCSSKVQGTVLPLGGQGRTRREGGAGSEAVLIT